MLRLTRRALLSKQIKSFLCFLSYEKRSRGAVLDGENFRPSLPKNNSCAACFFFSLSCACVSVEEGLRQYGVLFSASGLCLFKSECETGVYTNFRLECKKC